VGIYVRDTPSIHSSRGKRLFGIVCNVRTKSVNSSTEVVVRTSYKIPLLHVRFESGIDCSKATMEETAAEITEGLALGVLSSTLWNWEESN
jgi:hypothetical protein